MILSANKTNLCALVREYTNLPPRMLVQFTKTPRVASFFLAWRGGRAYLASVGGCPMLSITVDGRCTIHRLNVDELSARGMTTEGGR